MNLLDVMVAVHALSTAMMAGLIWFVQLVHYPLMRDVGKAGFARYELIHMRRTTWIVAPLMGLELVSAVVLLFLTDNTWLVIGLGLVVVIWLSTAALQVPCHRRLVDGYDAEAIDRLVATNWIRTLAWTARSVIAILLMSSVF
ncbi:MAG: hypothetical protein ACYTHJ_06875 [Planctomycetota bacterium]|jgi:uncharacterized membrane protein